MQYITEKEIDKIASETGEKLKKEPKVRIMLSEDGKSPYWEGGMNGHFIRIEKGKAVEVPESIAELIEQSAKTMRMAEETAKAFQGAGKRV